MRAGLYILPIVTPLLPVHLPQTDRQKDKQIVASTGQRVSSFHSHRNLQLHCQLCWHSLPLHLSLGRVVTSSRHNSLISVPSFANMASRDTNGGRGGRGGRDTRNEPR